MTTMAVDDDYENSGLVRYIQSSDYNHPVMSSPNPPPSVALSRLEASIMGESALIDREHGRVLWESGGSTVGRLSASVAPKLDEMGVAHVKAKVLTSILVVGLVGLLFRWMQSKLQGTALADKIMHIQFVGSLVVILAELTVLRIPTFDSWFFFFVWALYMLESYTCSTREYISHTIYSPDDIEPYLEQLRNETPAVTWHVRSFHYEGFSWPKFSQLFAMTRRKPNSAAANGIQEASFSSGGSSFSRLRRKVVTSQASSSYQIKHCIDKTVAGVWKRAPQFSDAGAPFIKLVLSKLLVLSDSKTREDYMKQQSQFVSEHGQGDEYAEYSTLIHVPGFQRRILAVRPEASTRRMFRLSSFWIATLLLMTVPYRAWFSNHCDEVRVTVVKETFVTPPRRVDASQGGWLSSFYPATNTSKTVLEDENFRSIMRQIRLYRSSDPLAETEQNETVSPMDVPLESGLNATSNATLINATVADDDNTNTTEVKATT